MLKPMDPDAIEWPTGNLKWDRYRDMEEGNDSQTLMQEWAVRIPSSDGKLKWRTEWRVV